jgi:peroxiredoxin
MLRCLLVFLCLPAISEAKTPRPLADVAIQTPDRKKIILKQYRGKEIVVMLFLTNCKGCMKTIDMMNRIQKDYGAQGLQVVGAAIDENAAFSIAPWVQRYRPAFPCGFLERDAAIKIGDMAKDARPVVPVLMFIDGTGTVRVQYYGNDAVFKQDTEKSFRGIASALLKFNQQQAPKTASH